MPLLWVLRDLLNLKGTKFGCGIAQCGACTVRVDGRPVRSCVLPVANVGSREVTTIEAIGQTESGRRIQQAWLSGSPGAIGAFGANHHLRQSLVFLNVPTMQQPEAYVGHVDKLFDEHGKLANDGAGKFLRDFMQAFANWIDTIRSQSHR